MEKLKRFLKNVGYNEEGIVIITDSLIKILFCYKDERSTIKIVTECFLKHVKNPFCEKQLKIFLQSIDPEYVNVKNNSLKDVLENSELVRKMRNFKMYASFFAI